MSLLITCHVARGRMRNRVRFPETSPNNLLTIRHDRLSARRPTLSSQLFSYQNSLFRLSFPVVIAEKQTFR